METIALLLYTSSALSSFSSKTARTSLKTKLAPFLFFNLSISLIQNSFLLLDIFTVESTLDLQHCLVMGESTVNLQRNLP